MMALWYFGYSRKNFVFGTLKIGENDSEIPNLEFENHGFLENQVFLPTEQVGTNICWIFYQGASFKICLSLFDWKVNILTKMHIVQCSPPRGSDQQRTITRRKAFSSFFIKKKSWQSKIIELGQLLIPHHKPVFFGQRTVDLFEKLKIGHCFDWFS